MRRTLVTLGFVLAAVAACGSEAENDPSDFGGGEKNPAAGGGNEVGGFGEQTGGDAATGTNPAGGCKRVDLVIATDNSGSMQQEKDEMRSVVFPAFARKLAQVGGGLESYRVGVLDACPKPATFRTRGAGGACNFASGKAWMEAPSATLEAEFACVGDIFSGDSLCSDSDDEDEQPASAAAAALEPEFAGPGKPNEGFKRDDALLVVIAITDEDEQPLPAASATQVYDRLLATKGADVKRIVFLGIGGAKACTGAYGSAKESANLKELTGLFSAQGRGVFWDLCAGKLEDGLDAAMKVIEQACEELPPTVK